jgi:hypothetical protein
VRLLSAKFAPYHFIVGALTLAASMAVPQNPPTSHVIIPNPTPRPPDLKQEYGNNPADQKKRQDAIIKNQLRAREIWLESNQILLLSQQVQQDVLSGKHSSSLAVSAAKVAQIEKLAQSVQEKMKSQ